MSCISMYHTSQWCFLRILIGHLGGEQQVLLTSEQTEKHKIAPVSLRFVAVLLEINQILDLLIIQLVWYMLKQLFTSVSVKLVDIYLHFGE